MTVADESTVLLPLAEAAPRLGLHPSALRSRIRRGLVTAKKGNDKRILVEVPANARPVHDEAMGRQSMTWQPRWMSYGESLTESA
jgi:hypothetical protein